MSETMLGEAATATSDEAGMDEVRPDEAWQLSPAVAIRPEPFGALAYHFGNRRLTFLKRPELVEVVRGLAEHPDVGSALHDAGVPTEEYDAYLAALRGLAATDMIRPRPDAGPDNCSSLDPGEHP